MSYVKHPEHPDDDNEGGHGREPAGERRESETPAAPSPFEAFEAFARKVVSVPKTVIDRRERVYKERDRGNGRKPGPPKAQPT